MTTAPTLSLSLENEVELEEAFVCRFCGCTDGDRCLIFAASDGIKIVLATKVGHCSSWRECREYIEGVCDSPPCLRKLLAEKEEALTGVVKEMVRG